MIDNRYVQLEYLESSGTQYIDTDLSVDSYGNNEMVVSLEYTDVTTSQLFGANNGGYFGVKSGADYNVSSKTVAVNTPYTYDIKRSGGKYTRILNGTSYSTGSIQTRATTSVYLFAIAGFQSLSNTKCKVKHFEYYVDNVLVRDLVPAKRKSDGVLGMFDKVNNVFYTNAGTGSFIGGKEIKEAFRSRIVPHAYTQLSHLESTGTQYIDTGLKGSLDIAVELKYRATTPATNNILNIFGDITTSTSALSCNTGYGGAPAQPTSRFGNKSTGAIVQNLVVNTDYTITTNKNTYTIKREDGSVAYTYSYNTTTAFTTTNNLWMFACNNGNSTSTYTGGSKFYYCKIWDNNVLVRNFIPVVRKIDNVAGMYDTVDGKFYTNAGTGSFIVGNEILTVDKVRMGGPIKGYEFYDYLENTASQRIDTGILPKANQDYEIRFKLNTVSSNYAVFGGRDTQTNKTATLFFLSASKSFRFDRTSQLNVSSGIVPHAGDVFKFECTNGVATLTNETTGQSATTAMTGSYNLDGNYPIHLFCVNTAGTDSLALDGSIYEWKLKEDGELVQHLVPAKRLSDNSIGMLDLVSRDFHTNIGSGVFTTGSVVPAPVEPKEVQELRLPYNGNKYKFFDYIQSSGTQWIDSGIKTGTNIKLDYEYEATAYNGSTFCAPIAARVSATSNAISHGFNSNSTYFGFGNNSEFALSPYFTLNTRYHIVQDKTAVYVNGVKKTYPSTQTTTFTTPLNLYLFARNNTNTVGNYFWGKLYYAKIYDNDVLVRDFLPAQRLSDNAIGMYDKITNTFFENKGTGVFKAGNEIVNIPKEYERLEYLQTDGNQYIDTGWQPASKVLAVEFKVNCVSSMATASICGSESSSFSKARWLFTLYGQKNDWQQYPLIGTWNNGSGSGYYISTPQNTDVIARIDYNDGTTTCTSSQGDNWTHTQSGDNITNHKQNLRLFQNSDTQRSSIKMYSYKIWDNNVLVRDFVPVQRKSDGVLGMLDIVNNVFYTNAGTGSFTTSTNTMPNKVMMPFWKRYPDIPSQYEVKEYLESDGNQYIDTGIAPNGTNTGFDIVYSYTAPRNYETAIGVLTKSGVGYFGLATSTTQVYRYWGNGDAKTTSIVANKKYHVTENYMNDKKFIWDDGVLTWDLSDSTTIATGNIWLFDFNPGSYTGKQPLYGRIYSCKITEGTTLVRNFVPVKRKSDGVLGMYDIVTDTLFTNAGTGSFTAE